MTEAVDNTQDQPVGKAVIELINNNLAVFCEEYHKLRSQGWEPDGMNPPQLLSYFYHTVFKMDEDKVKPPAKSRAEVLATARAAKQAKREEADKE